jgi:hypothetical protein
MYPVVCTQLYNNLVPPWLGYRFYLAFKVAFSFCPPINGGLGDWFILAPILKYYIADITEDYTDSIVCLNF